MIVAVVKPPVAYKSSVNPTGSVRTVINHPKLFRPAAPTTDSAINATAGNNRSRLDPAPAGRRRFRAAVASLATVSLLVAGCSTNLSGMNNGDDQKAADQPVAGTPATPAKSPQVGNELSGQQKQLPVGSDSKVLDAAIVSANPVGKEFSSAILTKGAAYFLASNKLDQPKKVELDGTCDNLNTTDKGVAVGCEGTYLELDPKGGVLRKIQVDGHVNSGTTTNDGHSVIGIAGQDKAVFFDNDGKKTKDEVVSRSLDKAVLVRGQGDAQRVAMIDRGQTTINDIDPKEASYKASLRIGQGVGDVAAGTGDDAVLVASDNRQDQVMIYTMGDVVRLHQSAPTGKSPWAVAWDSARKLAFVSTTADNRLRALDIASGTPVEVGDFNTVGDVRHVLVQPDGGVMLIGESNKAQLIPADEIENQVREAKDKGTDETKKFPVELKDSEEK